MTQMSIIVRAIWDEDASVWVAQSNDVVGLAVEAGTIEELTEKVLNILPELLALNEPQREVRDIPVHFFAERFARLTSPYAA